MKTPYGKPRWTCSNCGITHAKNALRRPSFTSYPMMLQPARTFSTASGMVRPDGDTQLLGDVARGVGIALEQQLGRNVVWHPPIIADGRPKGGRN